ncbi:MAG TPA: TonB-dependent receptor [Gemmatimonadota bacterium]|jgi:outer membrane receptor protein involved in Fe transport
MMRRLVCVAWLLVLACAAGGSGLVAQEAAAGGRIQGKIVDSETGDPLVGAEVYVQGTQLGGLTDLDGKYELDGVPVGTQALRVLYLGYAEKIVSGVAVTAEAPANVDVGMVAEAVIAEGVTVEVTAQEERGSVEAALSYQRSAMNVVSGVSSQEIARAPDSDAAEAVRRVSSASIVDDKYVYVRGLGERYSTALLDNTLLPTPEPEKRVVPLDLFPTNMIESVFTVKSFTADLPGNFAGGLVNIQTKDIPDEGFFRITTGIGYNSSYNDNDVVTYPGGDTDWLGIDDGTRALPGGLPDLISVTTPPAQAGQLHSEFEPMGQSEIEPVEFGDYNKSFGFSFGNKSRLFGKDGGYTLGLSYSYKTNSWDESEFFPSLESDLFQYDFDSQIGSEEALWGVLGGYSMDVGKTDRLSLKVLFTQDGEDETRIVTGPFDLSTSGFALINRLTFVERTLLSTLLRGEHKVQALGDGRLEWDASYGYTHRDEPDTRQIWYTKQSATEGTFAFNESGDNGRFFSTLSDNLFQGNLKLSSRVGLFGESLIEAGLYGGYRTRDFDARRFSYEAATQDVRELPPDQLFTSSNIAAGDLRFLESTQATDQYEAKEPSGAAFASLDIGLSSRVRMTPGLRVEVNDTQVDAFDPRSGAAITPLSADLSTVEPLPTLNVRWEPTTEQVVQVSAARTIVRPDFRELAPFRYDNYLESTLGNPFLQNGSIYNADLRWSLFPAPGEIVSLGVFYKYFNDPIEIVRLPTGGTNVGSPEPYNAPSAQVYGVELELRQDLTRVGLTGLGISGNVALADSKVKQDEPVEVFLGSAGSSGADLLSPEVFTNSERPMAGQSDFLVNASLYYTLSSVGTTATVLYNGVGKRLYQVGTQGFDDIYELPRHTFDVTLEQPLFQSMMAKLAIENLTNAEYRYELGDVRTREYKAGRQIKLDLGYTL